MRGEERERLQVTVVDSDLPYPSNSGKRLRSLNLVLPLAKRHAITYVARVGDPAEGKIAEVFLRDHGIEPILVEEPLAAKAGLGFYWRLARNLVSPMPYSAALHITPAMRAAVAAHARDHRIDVMQLEHVNYMYCHEGLDCPLVVQAHNIESLIWKRMAATTGNPVAKAYFGLQCARYHSFEETSFRAIDRVIAVSEADAALARDLYGAPRMAVVDNGVDIAGFRDVVPATGSRQVLFLGALDWRPNLDAIEQLLGSILPALRAKVPDAHLAIVGRKPSDRLRRTIAEADGASLHADVPDTRPYMASSAVMAVPLRIGGGSRLKILESLAASLPVVSSTVGAEGLELTNGRDLVIADTPDAFVEALADAITSPDRARALALQGRSTVSARYDWPMLAERLETVWMAAIAERQAGPV